MLSGTCEHRVTPHFPSVPFCRYDLQTLSLDFLELLTRFLPTEYERSLIDRFEKEQRPLEELSEEDRFMLRFSRIQRLPERMNTLTFLGNFPDTAQLLMPVWAGRAGLCGGAWAGGWGGGVSELSFQESSWEYLSLLGGGAPAYLSIFIPPLATECHHCSLNVHQVL